ncbi:hypothetical protein ADL22_11470 [Streptomyces sp. NRRL F-4489]|uniref:DUF3817 domain-containing protein n=1 Tax=Streptomyces sp. NRRL F-4489 TaxID=1609095 RepID=UPI00074B0177|nr:DUF3817 domain-containing protein [Streptomyces sp. NRRL F-4489]KUL46114.1 hypothetical protein ADL22_11470 [Streptomyces sp. NRRL F-4489]
MTALRRPLRAAATTELASLIILLANLATVHLPAVSSLAGPLHGCAYLFTLGAVARDPDRTPRAIVLACVPGIGGMLALRRLGTVRRPLGVAPR